MVFPVTLNVQLRMKDLAFNRVDRPRNLTVIIAVLSVGNKMVCLGIFLKHCFNLYLSWALHLVAPVCFGTYVSSPIHIVSVLYY